MIGFIEDAVKIFNKNQQRSLESQTVKTTFEKLGQSPSYEGDDDKFIKHLDTLNKTSHFQRNCEEWIVRHKQIWIMTFRSVQYSINNNTPYVLLYLFYIRTVIL